jgi:hypothetical protein
MINRLVSSIYRSTESIYRDGAEESTGFFDLEEKVASTVAATVASATGSTRRWTRDLRLVLLHRSCHDGLAKPTNQSRRRSHRSPWLLACGRCGQRNGMEHAILIQEEEERGSQPTKSIRDSGGGGKGIDSA